MKRLAKLEFTLLGIFSLICSVFAPPGIVGVYYCFTIMFLVCASVT